MISPYSSWSLFALALITLQWLCSHNTCLHTASDLSIHVPVSPLRTYTWHLLRKPKYPTGPSNSLSTHYDGSDLSTLVLISPLRTYTNTSRLKQKKQQNREALFSVSVSIQKISLSQSSLWCLHSFHINFWCLHTFFLVSPLINCIQHLLCKTQKAIRTTRLHFHWHFLHQSKKANKPFNVLIDLCI